MVQDYSIKKEEEKKLVYLFHAAKFALWAAVYKWIFQVTFSSWLTYIFHSLEVSLRRFGKIYQEEF